MNKRLFICADRNFPRGDAGSNRILFMAKALQEKGWNVIVISTGKRNKQDYNATAFGGSTRVFKKHWRCAFRVVLS